MSEAQQSTASKQEAMPSFLAATSPEATATSESNAPAAEKPKLQTCYAPTVADELKPVVAADATKPFYQFTMPDINNNPVTFSRFMGKVCLVVNVACECGFAGTNYADLVTLYNRYKGHGFEVLAFPCNQWNQEKGSNVDIVKFNRFKGATFPLFAKVNVNGSRACDLFRYLKQAQRGFLWTTSVKWNFTKFLVDAQGNPVKRYGTSEGLSSMEPKIRELLGLPKQAAPPATESTQPAAEKSS